MTADALSPATSTPTAITCRHQALREGYRLFPTRLSFERTAAQSGNPAPRNLASVTRLLARLQVEHSGLERRIAEEAGRPRPDFTVIDALKRERLAVRDRMAALERGV